MVCKNNRVPNDHLRKDWYKRVKFFFDDPARARRRRNARLARAKKAAPAPISGLLRPIVHCTTVRYNTRVRLGRGFSRCELVKAGINPVQARFIGIAYDRRRGRRNSKEDPVSQVNIDRLRAYKEKLQIFNNKKEFTEGYARGSEMTPQQERAVFNLPAVQDEIKFCTINEEMRKADHWKDKLDAKKAKEEAKKSAKESAREAKRPSKKK